MTTPTPPENVRLVYPDGSEVPLELIYLGQDSDGVHEWRAVNPIEGAFPINAKIEMLPALTKVTFPMTFKGELWG